MGPNQSSFTRIYDIQYMMHKLLASPCFEWCIFWIIPCKHKSLWVWCRLTPFHGRGASTVLSRLRSAPAYYPQTWRMSTGQYGCSVYCTLIAERVIDTAQCRRNQLFIATCIPTPLQWDESFQSAPQHIAPLEPYITCQIIPLAHIQSSQPWAVLLHKWYIYHTYSQ